MPYSPDRLLNLIQCSANTPIALVDTEMIEEIADIAIKKWCLVNKVDEFEVARECTLYLQPKDSEFTIKEILA